jgi:hypothetical protein
MGRQVMTSSSILLPYVLLPGTARHTLGRDDAVLVTAWRLGQITKLVLGDCTWMPFKRWHSRIDDAVEGL